MAVENTKRQCESRPAEKLYIAANMKVSDKQFFS